MKTIEGTITKLLTKNTSTGKFVAEVLPHGSTRAQTAIGYSLALSEKSEVLLIGEKDTTCSYGKAFLVEETRVVLAGDSDGLAKYLMSAVKGLGETKAKKLVESFGKEALEILKTSPSRIADLPGFGAKSAQTLHENWCIHLAEGVSEKDINAMTFLMRHGFTKNKASKLYEFYGKDCLTKLKLNPYIICKDMKGFGFLTADKFAKSLGVALDSGYRIRAGILYLMEECLMEGSCGLSVGELGDKGATLLGIPAPAVSARLDSLIESGELIADMANGDFCVFLPYVYHTETGLASLILKKLDCAGFLDAGDAEVLADRFAKSAGIVLEDMQKKAVKTAFCSGMSVLTGPPGSGKTTILKTIIAGVASLGKSMALCAPTGKASRRMEESVGRPAKTLHSLLGVRGGKFVHNSANPLPYDFIVIDEFSMVDIFLAKSFFEAIGRDTVVLVVGDHNQIPSIGPGRVLSSLIRAKAMPVTLLDKIHRQAEGSGILKAAFAVNQGKTPEHIKTKDFSFVNLEDTALIHDYIIKTVRDAWKKDIDPIKDVMVLSPMKKGLIGVDNFNRELQKLLNPFPVSKYVRLGKAPTTFGVGDKVIHIKNDRVLGLMNGEVGFVTDTSETGFTADFSGKLVTYEKENLFKVELAYAITTHKSQGSEAKMVISPVSFSHFKMLLRDLLYTGMTRAREYLELVGEKKALWVSVKNNQTAERHTRLEDLLKKGEILIPEKEQGSLF